jgi:cation transport protein ChaC
MMLTAELVARCHRSVADPGQIADDHDYFTGEDHRAAVESLLAARPPGPFWVFAYGSLIWKPEFHASERRRVVAHGWQRAFSMEIARFRGSPEQPGYMMCLDEGGTCEGVALRIPEQGLWDQLYKLLVREIGSHEAMESARWIDVRSGEGMLTALTFYAAPTRLGYYRANRPVEEIAHALARACGHWGSGAEYLRNTVVHLAEMGIHDPHLWDLQERVAQEIMALHGGTPEGSPYAA